MLGVVQGRPGAPSGMHAFPVVVQHVLCCDTSRLTIKRFSEDADTLADIAHLQDEQPSKVAPEIALECARCVAVTAQFGADGGGLRRSLWRIWSDLLREQDGDHV